LQLAGTNAGKSNGFVDSRRNRILDWIRPVVSPQVGLTITSPTSSSTYTTSTDRISLGGNAPVEAFQIVVLNDRINYRDCDVPPPALSNSSMTGWTISDIPLAPGVNNLTVVGFTSEDSYVGQDTLRVTCTLNWSAPSLSSIDPDRGLPGDVVTIRGSNFQTGMSVFFGDQEADPAVCPESSSQIQVRIPLVDVGLYDVTVRNVDDQQSNSIPFSVTAPTPEFIRGDTNLDRNIDISDAVKALFHLYTGPVALCEDAMDVNDDANLDLTDVIYLLEYLFRGGPEPPQPFPQKGMDPTGDDDLGCEAGV